MTPEEIDSLLAEVEHYPGLYGGVGQKLAAAIAALREQRDTVLSNAKFLLAETTRLEADNAALRQLLASISQRIVKALYDDPVERKGIATVIDAAMREGKG